jgi:hypothetical protein
MSRTQSWRPVAVCIGALVLVIGGVVGARYLTETATPAPPTVGTKPYDFFGVTLNLPGCPEVDSSAVPTTVSLKDTDCDGPPSEKSYPGFSVYGPNDAADVSKIAPACRHDSSLSTHAWPASFTPKKVGDIPASVGESNLCSSGRTETLRVWRVPTSKGTVVFTTTAGLEEGNAPLGQLLASATVK